jgi:hypothetical protein
MGVIRYSALASTMLSGAAFAQSFPKPPDVPAYVSVAPLYKTDGTDNFPLDSTVTPMPIGTGLTNIPIPSTTGRVKTTVDRTPTNITGSITSNVLNATSVTGTIRIGDYIAAPGVTSGTRTTSQVSGALGDIGKYNVTATPNVGSESMVSTAVEFCLTVVYGGQCGENKFRTIADHSHILPDDPIRNWNLPGTSHCHDFFGGGTTNASSTYASLRAHGLASKAAGTDTNGTGYWFTCVVSVNPFGNGKNYVVVPDWVTVYYTENPATDGTGYGTKARIPVGQRYVFGFDMDATVSGGVPQQFAWLQTTLDAANTTIGHARYSLANPSTGHLRSQVQYTCINATPLTVDTLRTSGGGDPFGGTCNGADFNGSITGNVLTVNTVTKGTMAAGESIQQTTSPVEVAQIVSQSSGTTGGAGTYLLDRTVTGGVTSQALLARQDLVINIGAPGCFDGTNLWSPGGYKNVIPEVWDSDKGKWVCPYNYYLQPHLTLEIHLSHYGWTGDREFWDLASDMSYRTARSLTTAQLPPGTTFHTDWMDGWDHVQMNKWLDNCSGVEHQIGHECNVSQIDNNEALVGGVYGEAGAGGRPHQVDVSSLSHVNATDPGFILLPSSWTGGMALHVKP